MTLASTCTAALRCWVLSLIRCKRCSPLLRTLVALAGVQLFFSAANFLCTLLLPSGISTGPPLPLLLPPLLLAWLPSNSVPDLLVSPSAPLAALLLIFGSS